MVRRDGSLTAIDFFSPHNPALSTRQTSDVGSGRHRAVSEREFEVRRVWSVLGVGRAARGVAGVVGSEQVPEHGANEWDVVALRGIDDEGVLVLVAEDLAHLQAAEADAGDASVQTTAASADGCGRRLGGMMHV